MGELGKGGIAQGLQQQNPGRPKKLFVAEVASRVPKTVDLSTQVHHHEKDRKKKVAAKSEKKK
jgi:hypothetical protein